MHFRRQLTRAVAEAIALGRTFARPRRGFRILMYHAVESRVPGDTLDVFRVTPGLFSKQMAALAAFPDSVVAGIRNAVPARAPLQVAITFDDGYRDNLRLAAPVLLKHGFAFTVFATAGFIRSGKEPFLSPTELRELAALPQVTIGAHGVTHVPLTRCDDRQLREELTGSKHYLEDLLGRPVKELAYPHGAVDRRVRDAAGLAGYDLGATSHFNINTAGRDPLLLARNAILASDDVRAFIQKLRGDWDWYRWRSPDPAAA